MIGKRSVGATAPGLRKSPTLAAMPEARTTGAARVSHEQTQEEYFRIASARV